MEENRMSTRGVSVSAIAIIILLGLVALAALPAALAAGPPTRPLALQSSAGDAAVTIPWLAPARDGGAPVFRDKGDPGVTRGGGTPPPPLLGVGPPFPAGPAQRSPHHSPG